VVGMPGLLLFGGYVLTAVVAFELVLRAIARYRYRQRYERKAFCAFLFSELRELVDRLDDAVQDSGPGGPDDRERNHDQPPPHLRVHPRGPRRPA